ncbi:MAG TPA: hypothetical protein VNO30_40025 [Kofleriaceae bacterium]|nr:hypothetical protein [Kofleriaceae bacterium]
MSLADFQRAFAMVVTDPATWATRLAAPDARVGHLELTEREIERLRRILGHRGMRANHLLLRANRLMPIQGALPLTCDWLRDQMSAVLDAWLAMSNEGSVQYQREAARFAAWLPGFLARDAVYSHPALDALRYEQGLAKLASIATTTDLAAEVEVRFDHDPDVVLEGWSPNTTPLGTPLIAHLRIVDALVVLDREDPDRG